MVMAMTGTAISRAPISAASNGLSRLDVTVDVLHHDDGVVDDETDGQHQGQQRQEVDRVAERQQREHHADERQRDGDDRDERRAQAPRNRKMTRMTMTAASISVFSTSLIDASMNLVES